MRHILILTMLLMVWLSGCYPSGESRFAMKHSTVETPSSLIDIAASPSSANLSRSGSATRSRARATLQPETAIPLIDMGEATYFGFEGGLYPGGANEMPASHARGGLARARMIQPLNPEGLPDPNGKYVLLSIGMSNTAMEFCGVNTNGVSCQPYSFMGQSARDAAVNHSSLFMLNGARGAQAANRWDAPNEQNYNRIRDGFLTPLGLSEKQVQVIWLKTVNAGVGGKPALPLERADAYRLVQRMGDIVRALKVRYPNLQQVFISSRIYAGYATRPLNPEPYAYESGFGVKWLIEAQIKQMEQEDSSIDPLAGDLNYETVAPWIAWGPYLWADGRVPRSDGLVWRPEDFGDDGTHPSVSGRQKVGTMLLDFFKTSPYTRCWFLTDGECG